MVIHHMNRLNCNVMDVSDTRCTIKKGIVIAYHFCSTPVDWQAPLSSSTKRILCTGRTIFARWFALIDVLLTLRVSKVG